MTALRDHLRRSVEVGRTDRTPGQHDDPPHYLGPRYPLADKVSLSGPRIVQVQFAGEVGDAPPTLPPVLVKGHEARMAMIMRPVKANLASDPGARFGQSGHMSSRLHEIMIGRGVKPADLARSAKIDPSTLSKLELGKRKMTHVWARQLAPFLSVTPNDLMMEIGAPIPAPGETWSLPIEGASNQVPLRSEMPRDVPVLGTAMGANGDGAFAINLSGPVDMVRRGPGLASNRSVFAIYVEGESMAPRFEPGDLVYLDDTKPIRIGDDVVLVVTSPQPGEPPRAYLKRLVRRTADRWICEQFNPAQEVDFPTVAIEKKFRVLRMHEVMGV